MEENLDQKLNRLYQQEMLATAHREQVLKQTRTAIAKVEQHLNPRRQCQ